MTQHGVILQEMLVADTISKVCHFCYTIWCLLESRYFRYVFKPYSRKFSSIWKMGHWFCRSYTTAHTSGRHRYILVATNYVSKWVEAEPTKCDNNEVMARFLKEDVIFRLGCPEELVSDSRTHFVNDVIME